MTSPPGYTGMLEGKTSTLRPFVHEINIILFQLHFVERSRLNDFLRDWISFVSVETPVVQHDGMNLSFKTLQILSQLFGS